MSILNSWTVRSLLFWPWCGIRRHPWNYELDAGLLGDVRSCSCGRRSKRRGYVGWISK